MGGLDRADHPFGPAVSLFTAITQHVRTFLHCSRPNHLGLCVCVFIQSGGKRLALLGDTMMTHVAGKKHRLAAETLARVST